MEGMEGMEGMEAVAHNPPALKTRRGFNLSSSISEAVGQPCKGFSLVEAAIVLALVGAVIGAIWVAAANMYENYRVNKTVEGIFSTARNIQNLISIRDAETIGNNVNISPALLNAKVFPDDWITGNSIKNISGGAVWVQNYTNSQRFQIVMEEITKQTCISLVVKVSSIGAIAGSYGSGDTARSYLGAIIVNSVGKTVFPISPYIAETTCNQNSNDVSFVFGYTRTN